VGKIDEIFGTLRDFFVSVKLSDEVKAHSFKKGQQVKPSLHEHQKTDAFFEKRTVIIFKVDVLE
jgi:rRNA processing protein Gar1